MLAPIAWINAQELKRLIFGEGIICPVCGRKFVRNSTNKLYCSKRCYDKKYNEEKKNEYV